ncbi:MAG: hypothetical protein ABSG19_01905 [Candidatus Aminicenantales bacterium]
MQTERAVCLASLFLFILFAAVGFAEESKGFKPGISLKLTGGGSYLAVGDINRSLGSIDRILSSRDFRAYSTDNVMKLNNWMSIWEAEVRFDISRRFSLGIAISNAVHLSNESSIPLFSSFSDPGSPAIGSFSSTPDIRVRIPMRFSIYYSLPVISRLNILFSTGVGYYSGKMAESWDYEFSDAFGTGWHKNHWETAWESTLGFQSGLGGEYLLSKSFALVLEAQYRYAKIRNFEATMNIDSSLLPPAFYYDRQGTLYIWGWGEDGPIGIGYGEPIVWTGSPPNYGGTSIAYGRSHGKAALDLSGFSFKLGIKIKLF